MLAEDARLVMPPLPTWVSGRDQVAAFLRAYPLSGARRWRMVPTSANGQPAFATYSWDERTAAFMPHSLSVLTLREGKIEEITAFMTPDPFPHFHLPASIAG
jgi:RNA polymerase sigma-70 factor (ECF subfamily)